MPRSTPAAGSDLLLGKDGERTANALASYAQGLAAEEDADTERALEAYRKTLSFDPANTELAAKVAFELARRGDTAQGVNILKDAAKAAPKDYLPPLWLSQIYGKFLKKPELAEKFGVQALALAPENFAPYLTLYAFYNTGGQAKKAGAVLDKAVKSPSTDPNFWLQLAELQIRIALKDDGTISASEAAAINPTLQKVLANAKDELLVLAKVADFFVLTKQVKQAIPIYMRVLQANHGAPGEELIAVRDKLAQALIASGQRDEAIAVLEQMVKDAPTRYETYEMLGELYKNNKQPEKAVASYQQALLIDSSQAGSFLRVAQLQLELKKFDEAVKTLDEARAKFPGVVQLSYLLAVSLGQAKQYVRSLSVFAEAQQEAKNSNEALLTSAFYFQYGTVAEQAGSLTKAVELLRKSIQLDPSNAAHAYNYLGYMWVDRGINLDEAGELIKRALALSPGEGAYLDSLGWYYFKVGKYDEALSSLKQAFERTQPEDPTVDEHLGDVYAAKGDFTQALTLWKKALALDPTAKGIGEKIQKTERKLTAAPAPSGKP